VAPFCTWCGTRQGTPERAAAGRRADQFAAHPNEAVLYPAVLTTLFPHLGHRQVNEFRWALLIGSAIIFVLYLAGLIGAALLAGALLVPIVYVLYLYEVRVYRDAPVQVLGLTLGVGVVLGVLVTLITDALASKTPLFRSTPTTLSVDVGGVIAFLVVAPIVVEAIKPLPALLLRRTGQFVETIDGVVFGVAAGLGFAAAESIIQLSAVIASGTIQTVPANWIYPLATTSIFMPLLHGTATGLITGALWRVGTSRIDRFRWFAIAVAVAAHVLFVSGTELLRALGFTPIVPVIWQAVVVGGLLMTMRVMLHRALLEEAADLGLNKIVCSNCHSNTTAAGFCPVCGMATTAMARGARPGRAAVAATETGA
jgi:RsiW-degrading membrane proteinase PrsW (M82 family)